MAERPALAVSYTNRIEQHFRLPDDALDIVQTRIARRIVAVGQKDHDFLSMAPVEDTRDAGESGVIQRRTACRPQPRRRAAQAIPISPASLRDELSFRAEAQNCHVIIGRQPLQKMFDRVDDILDLVFHAATGIGEESKTHRRPIIQSEERNLLSAALFEDAEILLFEYGHRSTPSVGDGSGDRHDLSTRPEGPLKLLRSSVRAEHDDGRDAGEHPRDRRHGRSIRRWPARTAMEADGILRPMVDLATLILRWRDDPGGTYRSWFLWEERLKNFRAIRRGIRQVVAEIEAGTFGNVYKGSSLETAVGAIAEQRQIFKGADHAFLWKPKLRIPDIYESRQNQLAFGRFLDACCDCGDEEAILRQIHLLDELKVKGLGPAAANLLYFLHPTIVPPFNTAIVRGYNSLTGAKVRLGRWGDFLAMRAGILRLNDAHRESLSNDLGAVGGLLFDVGSGRYPTPPRDGDAAQEEAWRADLARVRATAPTPAERRRDLGDRTHTEVQQWLRDLGRALGYAVHIAINDRGRPCGTARLGDGCLDELPQPLRDGPGADAVRLIDVLWINGSDVVAAFEVEHSTSIYSGIVRLLDLAIGAPASVARELFIVAPDERDADVQAQIRRPAFSGVANLRMRFLPYGELERHRESMARFGEGLKAIQAISRVLE